MLHVDQNCIKITAAGIIGGTLGALIYFISAFFYAIANNQATQNNHQLPIHFIPEKKYLALGLTPFVLAGFMLGVLLARYVENRRSGPALNHTTPLIPAVEPEDGAFHAAVRFNLSG